MGHNKNADKDDDPKSESDHESELSQDFIYKNKRKDFSTTLTGFDDTDDRSKLGNIFQVNINGLEQEVDPEQEEREDYMRKLMSFRKDELILADDSDSDADDDDGKKENDKGIKGVEDAYDIVEGIEDKMGRIAQVIRGMDKRMSYNMRLMGSVLLEPEAFVDQALPSQAN